MSIGRTIVAIFVKTPGHSAVKTRLAASVGTGVAESLYRNSLDCVRRAVDASGLARAWAVAEPEAADRGAWDDAARVVQPPGDLGTRMAGVFRALRADHDAVLLVGADLPQLSPGHLVEAAAWLAEPGRHVLGPARDGGFWLYGSSAEDPTAGWSGLPYSRRETAERFRAAIDAPAARWHELPTRTDLDDHDDLARVAAELDALDAPSAAQRELAARLRAMLEEGSR